MGETETSRGATRKESSESQVLPDGRKIFVGFGVHDYDHFQKLKNPKKDIEALGKLLRDDFSFDEIHLYSSKEETTHSSIRKKIREIPQSLQLQPNDTLILFLAGHGYREDNAVFFAGSNSPVDDAALMLGKEDLLKTVIPLLKCFHLMVMLDFCYAGGFSEIQDFTLDAFKEIEPPGNTNFSRIESIQSRCLIASGSQYEQVKDDAGGHSPFVKSLMNNLTGFTNHEIPFNTLANAVFLNLLSQSTVVTGELEGSNRGYFIFRRKLEIPTSSELKKAFLQLNFTEQISKITTPAPFNLIYVQGTPSCAHHLFAQRYFQKRKKKDIQVLQMMPYKIRLGARESDNNSQDIWQLLNTHFIQASETISPEEIVEIIWDKMKQSNHAIFFKVEDNIYNLNETLSTFWRNWNEIIVKKNFQKPAHLNNFFMFILDRRGKAKPLLDKDLLPITSGLSSLMVFPQICPLKPDEINDWLITEKEDIKAKAFQNLAVDQILLEEYYIQETILAISELCKCKKSYDEIFLKQWV